MADAPVLGDAKRSVTLDGDAFGARFNGPLVHETVRAEFAARRRGSASTKTRGLVRGGGAKPWRQKGTGRARAGSSRSPIWTGGGTVFGPHQRSYTFKVNRKERRAALRSALSLHADRGSLAILDVAGFSAPSTRTAASLLGGWIEPRPTLVVVTAEERDAALSFRNIARVSVLEPSSVGVADIVGATSLLCSDAALAELSNRAASSSRGAAEDAEAPAKAAAATPSSRAAGAAAAAPISPAVKAPAARTPAKVAATEKAAARASAAKPGAKATADKPAAKVSVASKPTPKTAAAEKPAASASAAKPGAEATAGKPAAKVSVASKPTPKTAAAKKPAASASAAKPGAEATARKPAAKVSAASKPTPKTAAAKKPAASASAAKPGAARPKAPAKPRAAKPKAKD
jgi:large subunit ribosomal protein L4